MVADAGTAAADADLSAKSDVPMTGGLFDVSKGMIPAPVRAPRGVRPPQRAMMRVVDVVGASILIVLGTPLALAGALLMRLTSPGPALFRQKRVGRDGEVFIVQKLRTMKDGTHAQLLDDPEMQRLYRENGYKLPADDPRITKVGGYLRKFSVDEIPQALNVIRGEMSLVGVRPLVPSEYDERPARFRALYDLHKPGMTGLWQVEGRSRVGHVDRIELDREYLETWSVWGDVKILARTPKAVLAAFGAH